MTAAVVSIEGMADDVRDEARTWFEENWDPDLTLREWWVRLANSGYAVPAWPEEWFGRAMTGDQVATVFEEREKVGAVGAPAGLGVMLAGPTIVTHGPDDVRERYLRDIVTGAKAWCQLFSEPGAGSDLASLQAKAVRDGDEWIVNGQKVWTSGAQTADLGMLLARTNPDAPKHQGITYFVIDMDQSGIDVRPLREMTGRALFNEVFITDARVSNGDIVGELNAGWAAGMTTLGNERVGLGGGGGGAVGIAPGERAGFLDKRAGDFSPSVQGKPRRASGTAMAMGARGAKPLIALAQERGVNTDPHIRQALAKLHSMGEVTRFSHLRSKAASAAGRRPGPEASTGKLMISKITRASRDVGLEILGASGMLRGADAPMEGTVQEMAIFSPAVSIYGGSDEIQKNIIGERVLGLPKEPGSDKDVPFKDLKVGTQR
jgi:alkylation response protein AidB-like acyl-CoA dehydrogenase